MNSQMNIKVKRTADYVDTIAVDGKTFLIQTEDLGTKSARIVTKTYQNGAIVFTTTTGYVHLVAHPDLKDKIKELMGSQHKETLNSCLQKAQVTKKSKALLGDEMRTYLSKDNRKAALEAVREALHFFPGDPFFLSHLGYLLAVVEKKTKEGRTICEDSIKIMSKTSSADKEFFYPIQYLNLGRTYLSCNQKMDALDAFYKGLKYDSKNRELRSHIDSLGRRKNPVIPFLARSNPLNKYLGKLRHRMQTA